MKVAKTKVAKTFSFDAFQTLILKTWENREGGEHSWFYLPSDFASDNSDFYITIEPESDGSDDYMNIYLTDRIDRLGYIYGNILADACYDASTDEEELQDIYDYFISVIEANI